MTVKFSANMKSSKSITENYFCVRHKHIKLNIHTLRTCATSHKQYLFDFLFHRGQKQTKVYCQVLVLSVMRRKRTQGGLKQIKVYCLKRKRT